VEPAVVGKNRGHTPIRTCISCGTKKAKKEMTRLVVRESGFVRDDLGSRKGRGAYICDTEACREQLMKNRRPHRVFRGDKHFGASAGLGKSRERVNRVNSG
jgi:predicted RNA-binding protein YlxR (DUF448 family)